MVLFQFYFYFKEVNKRFEMYIFICVSFSGSITSITESPECSQNAATPLQRKLFYSGKLCIYMIIFEKLNVRNLCLSRHVCHSIMLV